MDIPSRQAAGVDEMLRRLVTGSAVVLVAMGLTVLLGWALQVDRLMMVKPGYVSMKPNTAVCFVLSGLALAGVLRARAAGRRAARVLGAVLAVAGALALLEYGFGLDFHIDQLLFRDPLQFPYPGRMSWITAGNFCLAGAAFLLMGRSGWQRWAALAAETLLLLSALGSVVGFLYGTPIFYGAIGVAGQVSMALHTGASFLLLSATLLVADETGWVREALLSEHSGGWITRWGLPAVILGPIALGWMYLRLTREAGGPRMGMSLLAVTLVMMGAVQVLVVAHALNRTERERTEAANAVARSEHELQLVTDHLPTLISYVGPDGRLLRVNRTYELWMDRPAEEIVGMTVEQLLGPKYWAETAEVRRRASAGETVTTETIYPASRGDRHVMVTYAPDFSPAMDDRPAELRGFVCMVLDVEERRRSQAALLESEKLAVVGRLASTIAHEINNPLEAVTNLLYLAGQDVHQEPAAQFIEQAQQELGRVTHIVTQTLKFHRQSSRATETRLSGLVQQVLQLYGNRLVSARVEALTRFRGEAPVLCKEGEIRQVLANLVGNAVDAMKGGGRLMVRVKSSGRSTVVTVADSGHGIPASVRAKLFEAFQTTKGEMGSGLGLWVSREIVERHGGRLQVRSKTEGALRGTVFRMVLPSE